MGVIALVVKAPRAQTEDCVGDVEKAVEDAVLGLLDYQRDAEVRVAAARVLRELGLATDRHSAAVDLLLRRDMYPDEVSEKKGLRVSDLPSIRKFLRKTTRRNDRYVRRAAKYALLGLEDPYMKHAAA